MYNNILKTLFVLFLSLSLGVACGNKNQSPTGTGDDKKSEETDNKSGETGENTK